ncbi:MAG: hydrogenase maturation protease [Desulfuromonadales bacterium]|nr:hydrogenase maturation protease [Desulfuromonadales bacterium]
MDTTGSFFPATTTVTGLNVRGMEEVVGAQFGLMPPRRDIMVIGIGNPLRGDDAVGLYLLERLSKHFSGDFRGIIAYEADIGLAEEISSYPELLIIDAMAEPLQEPFKLFPLAPAATIFPAGGFSSHIFNWRMVLAMSRDIFGRSPKAVLCGISAYDFEIDECLSPSCQHDADAAFAYLTDLLRKPGEGVDKN